MPRHGGFAIGLERWVVRLAGATNAREVTPFPRDLHRLTPQPAYEQECDGTTVLEPGRAVLRRMFLYPSGVTVVACAALLCARAADSWRISLAELPSGTVTFLFTDLEVSTRLWEHEPDAMKQGLARHDAILRDAVAACGGQVVKGTGDGVHAVFATADAAVAAAIDAQLVLSSEPWPVSEPLRVRMGVHTGVAELREDDYFGSSVNRAARLMAIAHGGQIVISHATEELVCEALPDGIELLDLGEHRLRDLSRPERVFQATAPGMQARFAPLRTEHAYPGNLPPPTTSFVGREAEVVAVGEALAETRIVTLTGVGGVGKTRLALQVAAEFVSRFPGGVWLCELAAAADEDAMVHVIAAALGVSPRHDMPLDVAVVEFLRDQHLLIVLDNCEHLLDAAGRQTEAILRSCRHVRVLATSREGLGVSGERILAVRSLRTPRPEEPPEVVAASEAARLFAMRAEAVRAGFVIGPANAGAVAEICRRLDGVPLAIELAAARVAAMTPTEIARRLDERFRLLAGARRRAVERHQTLRATVDWSHSLLDDSERMVFERLGVFVGSFDATAAIAVAGAEGIESWDVLDALGGLVAKSMLQCEDAETGVTRYVLLDTLRAYARERLEEAGAIDTWRRRHAEHYATAAERVAEELLTSAPWTAVFEFRTDVENFRAAVDWAIDSEDRADLELAVRIVAALGARVILYASWADRVLSRASDASPDQRAALLVAAAISARNRAASAESVALARAAIAAAPHDNVTFMFAHSILALGEASRGRISDGLSVLEEALSGLRSRGGNLVAEAGLESATARLLALRGDPAARQHIEEAVRAARSSGTPVSITNTLSTYATILAPDDPNAALKAANESVEIGVGANLRPAIALRTLLRVRAGEPAGALHELREALDYPSQRSYWNSTYEVLARAVRAVEALGDATAAAELEACAQAGPFAAQNLFPLGEREDQAQTTARIRAAIGDATYDAIIADAAALGPDAVVERALAILDRLIDQTGDYRYL
jgi:predicted ATPase/class 3 adenylate cyclase